MGHRTFRFIFALSLIGLALFWGKGIALAYLSPSNPAVLTADPAQTEYMDPSYTGDYTATPNPAYIIGPGSIPDYLTNPNWAYSPLIRKFVDTLPPAGCDQTNNLGQCIPIAVPDIVTYPGTDYYEIHLVEFREQMHSDLPAAPSMTADYGPFTGVQTAGTLLRGYIQTNPGTDTSACTDPVSVPALDPLCTAAENTVIAQTKPHYLGPIIISQTDRPVRVKFVNDLPTGSGGDLFIPVDTSIMGSGPFSINYDPQTNEEMPLTEGDFTQNRGLLHLHGGRSPWISDGTPHQWITPAGETTDYPTGVSVKNVPDMPVPGPGANTYYWTNQQSSRMMFYHDHAWGITRLNVYAGEAAGYLVRDQAEATMIADESLPGKYPGEEIPLVFQDKSYVDATTIADTDPTWKWGSTPVANGAPIAPVTGDLWWPHVYMPAQNPFDISGIAPMGRWAYGPYFWPATNNFFQPIPNPYYAAPCGTPGANPDYCDCDPANPLSPGSLGGFCQAPEIPSSPNPSWGAEAFMDTPTVNGTAYPVLNVEPKAYRFRVLNAAHDRFFNLQMYIADPNPVPNQLDPLNIPDVVPNCLDFPGGCAANTEVRMLPATAIATSTPPPGGPNSGVTLPKPAIWPEDGRPGGIPDWSWVGPSWMMIGNESGFLPRPVELPAQPVIWNNDVTTFNAGNVNGGSLILGPAERADVVVDFSQYAGQTLIVYNDAPAPWPALDPHYDYYTGAPDNRDMGGTDSTVIGFGPNTRTMMQIVVGNSVTDTSTYTQQKLLDAFDPATAAGNGAFRDSQDTIVVGQGNMNPAGDPALYEAFPFEGTDYSAYNTVYGATFPTVWPYWGVARINDVSLSFFNPESSTNMTVEMKKKAIQDEQGETFDEFGRMRAALGLTASNPGAGQINFVVQTFSDPSTEILEQDGIQVWKITHNGVDTHPIHFHLFDVQVLNRVGWDGFIRLPDPTEIGWKDTVRISPLEDTIVAVRPITPLLPFGLPESMRPLNPATPLGSTVHLSPVDPVTGEAWLSPNENRILNFDWEYVWHCHILSHEENDMMRPMIFPFAENLPAPPTPVTVTPDGLDQMIVGWSDPTPVDYVTGANFGNATNEIGFRIDRSVDGGAFTFLANALANTTTYTDMTATAGSAYTYRVTAFNAAGDSASVTFGKATMISPVDGSTLAGATETFTWSAVPDATRYAIWVGTAPGTYNITSSFATGTSITLNGLPTNGIPVYVRLNTQLGGVWYFNDYTYTASGTLALPAVMIAPVDGSTLSGASETFTWNAVADATRYAIWVGTAPGTYNITSAFATGTSITLNGLPTNGIPVYVRLNTRIGGVWYFNDYTYTASGALVPAAMITPIDGSTLAGASETFTWNAVEGATRYAIWVGTAPGTYNITSSFATGTSITLNGLPTNGIPVYVRLNTQIGGVWYFNNYTYTAFTQ